MKFFTTVTLVCVGASSSVAVDSTPPDLSIRGLTLDPRADLSKRSIVTDLFTGLADVVQTRKIDLNGLLVQGVNGLRNVSSSIDYNRAVNNGFSNAIDQNQQLAQIPFGAVVGGAVKAVLAGIDYNSLINKDGFNFIDGAVKTIDANAVTLSGINAISAAISVPGPGPAPAAKAASGAAPAAGAVPAGAAPAAGAVQAVGAASGPVAAVPAKAKQSASASTRHFIPASVAWLVAVPFSVAATLCL